MVGVVLLEMEGVPGMEGMGEVTMAAVEVEVEDKKAGLMSSLLCVFYAWSRGLVFLLSLAGTSMFYPAEGSER